MEMGMKRKEQKSDDAKQKVVNCRIKVLEEKRDPMHHWN
jgi:hypothetical protein